MAIVERLKHEPMYGLSAPQKVAVVERWPFVERWLLVEVSSVNRAGQNRQHPSRIVLSK